MEADFWQPHPLQHPVEHIQNAVRRDWAACARGEHVLASGFPLLLSENFHRVLSDGHTAVGVLCLERGLHHLAVDSGDLTAHLDRAALQVNVLPLESQQLTPAQARDQLDVVQLEYAALFRFVEEVKRREAAEKEQRRAERKLSRGAR